MQHGREVLTGGPDRERIELQLGICALARARIQELARARARFLRQGGHQETARGARAEPLPQDALAGEPRPQAVDAHQGASLAASVLAAEARLEGLERAREELPRRGERAQLREIAHELRPFAAR